MQLKGKITLNNPITINGKPVKLIPDGVEFPLEPVKALLMHNIKEFTHLASILPEVYGEFKDKFTF